MWKIGPREAIQLTVGLVLYGVGIALMVRAGLGVAPWDVLSLGLVRATGIDFGTATLLVSLVVLLAWWPLRVRPGIGSALNVLIIPVAAQGTLLLVPDASPSVAVRVLLLAGGMAAIALATGLYIGAGRGPGPRDGLMTGLNSRLGWPIWLARTVVEGLVTLVGWLLGGDVGVGTLAFALLIGPMVHAALPRFASRGGAGASRDAGAGASRDAGAGASRSGRGSPGAGAERLADAGDGRGAGVAERRRHDTTGVRA